jgi:hypothetical protein
MKATRTHTRTSGVNHPNNWKGHMAGITRREREDKARIQDIKDKLRNHPDMALHLYQRLNSSLTALQRIQDKRVAERKAKVETARAAEPKTYPCVLPDNGRLIRVPDPAQVRPFVSRGEPEPVLTQPNGGIVGKGAVDPYGGTLSPASDMSSEAPSPQTLDIAGYASGNAAQGNAKGSKMRGFKPICDLATLRPCPRAQRATCSLCMRRQIHRRGSWHGSGASLAR